MGRDEEGGGGAVLAQRLEGGGGVEAAEDGERPARQQGAAGEANGDRVVHRRADHVQVIAVEVPDGGLVLEDLTGRLFVPQPRRHALGPARRPRRVVHGAGQGMGCQIGRGALVYELGQVVVREDAHRGAGVRGQLVALDGGQGGVEQDRDEADAGGAQHRTYEVGRRAQREGDPVAPGAAPGQQGAGCPALAILGVGRVQQLDGGSVPGHRGRLRPHARTIVCSWGRLSLARTASTTARGASAAMGAAATSFEPGRCWNRPGGWWC